MNRQSFPFPWANGGEVTDPDLDTEHPSFVSDRYQGLGWKSEKLPSEWQNFLSNLSDSKIIELISQGLFEHREDISYPENAVVSRNNALYQNISGKIQTGAFVESAWSRPTAHQKVDYENTVNSLNKKYQEHLNKVNAHNDNVDTIIGGTWKKEAVDNAISSDTNPRTIPFHVKQRGKVHHETPEQVGTLPASGGKFTGATGFLKGLAMSGGGNVLLDPGSNTLVLNKGKYSIGIDAGGNAFWNEDGTVYLLLSEANYNAIEIRVNQMFVLPTPLLSINFATSFNDVMSVGDWRVEVTGNPTFGSVGFNKASAQTKFTNASVTSGISTTLCVYGVFDGNIKTVCKDLDNFSFTTLDEVANQVGAFTQVGLIRIFPQLSKYQKTMLVNSESK